MHVSNLIRTWEIERSGFFPSVTSLGKKKILDVMRCQ